MDANGQNSVPGHPNARGMLGAETLSGETRARYRTGPLLEIAQDTFSDDVIRRLIDDWLVPAIVDNLIGIS